MLVLVTQHHCIHQETNDSYETYDLKCIVPFSIGQLDSVEEYQHLLDYIDTYVTISNYDLISFTAFQYYIQMYGRIVVNVGELYIDGVKMFVSLFDATHPLSKSITRTLLIDKLLEC